MNTSKVTVHHRQSILAYIKTVNDITSRRTVNDNGK